MQRPDDHDEILLAASDLTNFLACQRLSQEQLKSVRGERGKLPRGDDPHGELVQRRGIAHEAEQLEVLSAAVGGHREVALADWSFAALQAAAEETTALLRAGVPLIYQGVLLDGRWQGRVDFLRRIDRPSELGDHAYEVIDTKLARQVKPAVVHQLALYTRMLAKLQGDVVRHSVVLLGDGTEELIDLSAYAALHRRAVARLERLVDQPSVDVYPDPVAHCSICRLSRECHGMLRTDDHLSFVAGASRTARHRLVAADIATLQALADADPVMTVSDLDPDRFHTLHHQAALQAGSRTTGQPTHRHLPAARERGYALLPPRDAGDVFFDFEGDPYVGTAGIEYLWGWTTADGEYYALWAHTTAEERDALEQFLDAVQQRRREHPDLHVYHYGAHEASKLKSLAQTYGVGEQIIDEWLRCGVLVDLYAVVRQGMQVGEESYSLKKLERHYGFTRREHTVRDGGGSIIAYESWLQTGEQATLDAIRDYNREDCVSTAALRDWLLDRMRPEAAEELPADFDELATPAPEEPPKEPRFMEALRPVLDQLLDGIPEGEDVEVTDDQAERRLLANLLLYHYRESKPQYWHWFAMQKMTPLELADEREAIGLIHPDGDHPIGTEARSNLWRYRFAEQETKLEPSTYGLLDPTTKKSWRNVKTIGDDHLILKVTNRVTTPPELNALIPGAPPDGGKVREAATEFARTLDDAPTSHSALRAVLRREPPALDVASISSSVDDLIAAGLALTDSYLAIQGPPGTGKTFRAAHMIVAALAAGRRVALTANSHAAIQNLLRAVEHRAHASRQTTWRGVYKGEGYASEHSLVATVDADADTLGDYQLIAGTAWLMANPAHRAQFDLLFVDEAGQFSLANLAGAGGVAHSLVLLGDPQQLPQVNQAPHPFGAGASVLEHLSDGHDVLPPDRGVFLEQSWRMHPDICRFVSNLSYTDTLHSTPDCSNRKVTAPGRLTGAGLRSVMIDHRDCSQASEAEADAIAALSSELTSGGATVTDDRGHSRSLTPDDILIVAPYNLARRCIQDRLPGYRVGTVDKFQGQEAPVVFFALTCSTGEDVPRGLGFLFDRNRLNVAISRAQCLAILVHSPRLLDADCKSLDHMRLVDGACRFVEQAIPLSLT